MNFKTFKGGSLAVFILVIFVLLINIKLKCSDQFLKQLNSTRYIDTVKIINSYQYPQWLSKCSDIYLDIGSNIGIQVKKFYEPEIYLNRPTNRGKRNTLIKVLNLYTKLYGPPAERMKKHSKLCVCGFEPNPKHKKVLKEIEKNYTTRGWNVHFFPFAITDENKLLTLYSSERNPVDDGASLYVKENKIKNKITVIGQSLPDFIDKRLGNIQIKLMKLDIEGSEFDVLTDLLLREMLCQKIIKNIYIEFHEKVLKKSMWNIFYKTPEDLVSIIKNQSNCVPTNILIIDDETFSYGF